MTFIHCSVDWAIKLKPNPFPLPISFKYCCCWLYLSKRRMHILFLKMRFLFTKKKERNKKKYILPADIFNISVFAQRDVWQAVHVALCHCFLPVKFRDQQSMLINERFRVSRNGSGPPVVFSTGRSKVYPLFVRWWFHFWRLFPQSLFLISPSFSASGRLRFVIVAQYENMPILIY